MSTAALPTFDGFNEAGGRYMWVNTSGRPCPGPLGGCEGRNEITSTLDDWTARGLPRTGWSFCKGRCHCVLVPMIDFGIGLDEQLDAPGVSFDTSEILGPALSEQLSDNRRLSDLDEVDPEDLVDLLESAPLVGQMREEVYELIEAFVAGELDLRQFLGALDDVIFGPREG